MLGINSVVSSKLLSAPGNLEAITAELSDLELVVCAAYISPTVSIDYHKGLYDYLHSLCDTTFPV